MKMRSWSHSVVCAISALLAFGAAFTAVAKDVEPSDFGAVDAAGLEELELGKWYLNWKVCKAYAESRGIPLFAVWSNKDCTHCFAFESALTNDAFKAWQERNDAGKVICCLMAGGRVLDSQGKDIGLDGYGSEAYVWMKDEFGTGLKQFPYVAFHWPTNGVSIHDEGDRVRKSTETQHPDLDADTANIIAALEDAFAGWRVTPYTGGEFQASGTAFDRYEAETGKTSYVTIDLLRENPVVSAQASTNYWIAIYPDGASTETNRLDWSAGAQRMAFDVQIDTAASLAWEDEAIEVRLFDDVGALHASSWIHFTAVANSDSNPLWKTERTEDTLAFGEWTCDLDVATNKVAAVTRGGQEAWTLVYSHGSQWCPYCYLNEKSFVGTAEFRAWAVANRVALVSVDTSHCSDEKPDVEIGTIWNRKADLTNLYFDGNGQVLRSGTGYLSRKMISDDEAAEMRATVRSLNEGLLHLPEDYQAVRSIIPDLTLLDGAGRVVGRLETFDYDMNMHTNGENAVRYCARLSEMIETARTSPDRASENRNDNCRTTPLTLSVFDSASGDNCASGTISHADYRDVRKLTGVKSGFNAIFRCRGDRDAQSRLCLIKDVPGAAIPELVATATNLLSGEIMLDTSRIEGFSFESGVNYYLRVSCRSFWPNEPYAKADSTYRTFRLRWGDGDDGFSRDYVSDYKGSTISRYEMSASVVCIPAERKNSADVPDGCSVLLRVEKDRSYRIVGFDSGRVPQGLVPDASLGAGYYVATADGDVRLQMPIGGGTVEYQIWRPGEVRFVERARDAFTHSGIVRIGIERTGGSSAESTVVLRLLSASGEIEGLYNWKSDLPVTWADGESGVLEAELNLIHKGDADRTGLLTFGLFDNAGKKVDEMQVKVIDTNRPCFDEATYRVAVPKSFSAGKVAFGVANVGGGMVTVSKVDGDLPPGVKIAYDAQRDEVVLSGFPKETGSYEVRCTLTERLPDGSVSTGYETVITLQVANAAEVNPHAGCARTAQSIPMYDGEEGTDCRLAGVLTVSITSQGRISGKFQGSGARPLTFDGRWEDFDAQTGVVGFSDTKATGERLVLKMDTTGALSVTLDGLHGWAELSEADFSVYRGYYNVTLSSVLEGFDPALTNGTGYLSLTMTTASAARRGKVRIAGRLPNGSTITSSAELIDAIRSDGSHYALLPVFRRTFRDVTGVVLDISPEGSINWCDETDPAKRELVCDAPAYVSYAVHVDAVEDYSQVFDASGVWYSQNVSPSWIADLCYRELYEPGSPFLLAIGSTRAATIMTTDRTLRIVEKQLSQLTLSFSRRTGVFGGRATIDLGGSRTVTGSYKGVLIPGWVRTCDCGYIPPERPFGMGTFWYRDVNADGESVTRSIPVTIDPVK